MKILFVGAHPDDIEMGAGGLIVKMLEKANCRVLVFTKCEEHDPENKGIIDEFYKSMSVLGIKEPRLVQKEDKYRDLENRELPKNADKVREVLEYEKKTFNPDIIVTHDIDTLHQDHKTVTEECLRVFRNTSILMFEDIKSVEYFKPNLIVSLTKEQFDKKLEALNCYKTQERRYYYKPKIIESLARVRGKQMNVDFGEGFKIHRFVFK